MKYQGKIIFIIILLGFFSYYTLADEREELGCPEDMSLESCKRELGILVDDLEILSPKETSLQKKRAEEENTERNTKIPKSRKTPTLSLDRSGFITEVGSEMLEMLNQIKKVFRKIPSDDIPLFIHCPEDKKSDQASCVLFQQWLKDELYEIDKIEIVEKQKNSSHTMNILYQARRGRYYINIISNFGFKKRTQDKKKVFLKMVPVSIPLYRGDYEKVTVEKFFVSINEYTGGKNKELEPQTNRTFNEADNYCQMKFGWNGSLTDIYSFEYGIQSNKLKGHPQVRYEMLALLEYEAIELIQDAVEDDEIVFNFDDYGSQMIIFDWVSQTYSHALKLEKQNNIGFRCMKGGI